MSGDEKKKGKHWHSLVRMDNAFFVGGRGCTTGIPAG
jgi:hypothetical protein